MGNFFSRLTHQGRTEPKSFQKDAPRPRGPICTKARRAVFVDSVRRSSRKFQEYQLRKRRVQTAGLALSSASVLAHHFGRKKPKPIEYVVIPSPKLMRGKPHTSIYYKSSPRSYHGESWENYRKKREAAMTAYVRNISKNHVELINASRPLPRFPAPPTLKKVRNVEEIKVVKITKKKNENPSNTEHHANNSGSDHAPFRSLSGPGWKTKQKRPHILGHEYIARPGERCTSRFSGLNTFRGRRGDVVPRIERPVHPSVESKERAEKKSRDRKFENVSVVSGRLIDVQYRVPRKPASPGNPLLDSKEKSQMEKRNHPVEGANVNRGSLIDVTFRGHSHFRSGPRESLKSASYDVQYRVSGNPGRPEHPLLDSKERSRMKKRNRRIEGVIVYRGTLIDVTYRGQSPFRSAWARTKSRISTPKPEYMRFAYARL